MVVPVGSLVNAGAVALGGCLGLVAGRVISEKMREAIFQALGLCTVLIGLKMALPVSNVMPVILSCVLGGLTGQALNLSGWLNRAGDQVKRLLRSGNERFTDGLVTTSILVCVGAMAIIGSLEEGLGGGRTTLFSKSILDFFAAAMLASAYGSGVVAAAGTVLIYQGTLTLLAGVVAPYLTEGLKEILVATGGLMIVGIGCNLLGIKPISIENLLPALGYAVVLGMLMN